ncbi:SGNH/GDSL hydrolase family protein [Pseudorhodobacter sp. E13]|uniref:SGNH/GDSL hydrolase family protein n=1 Tax=Pseudorhodobacter sp. E13 TaxID=2487931 RepID=UPI000F8F7E5F|nr:SGNH/GDSL hydrolase family protein [Pseudorhodobacter sp. E13]RUS60980.1 SGNH/GDSL hydrolase family protein [Pseudorhodobacter sp. E13]
MFKALPFLLSCLLVIGCGESIGKSPNARILLMGDSMMASNAVGGNTVANGIEALLGEEVIDRSVSGAKYFYYLPISGAAGLRLDAQYRPGPWEWVVLNGGGNDLLFGGGCGASTTQLDRLITPDGRHGAIPAFVANIRASGARVLYVGYLRNPGMATPIKSCGPAGNELDRRLTKMADLNSGVDFIAMADLVPFKDPSYHQLDRIHPSPKGSRAIAKRIVERIKQPVQTQGTQVVRKRVVRRVIKRVAPPATPKS